ncbi:MAG: hypothetical protein Q8861_02145 [Bacteroidota bacterium]|nr:hypothetical protein [Bacteroidota bacterium]
MAQITLDIPELDVKELNEASKRAAMKAAIEVISQYYNGYESPFKEKLRAYLKSTEINWSFKLPDIIKLINTAVENEINAISAQSISLSYLPMLKDAICRVNGNVKFSDILKEFKNEFSHCEDFTCDVDKNPSGWLNIHLMCSKHDYDITLHNESYTKENGKYKLLSMPYGSAGKKSVLFKIDNSKVELEYPATELSNNFDSYLVNLLISKSIITMDVYDFDEIDDYDD